MQLRLVFFSPCLRLHTITLSGKKPRKSVCPPTPLAGMRRSRRAVCASYAENLRSAHKITGNPENGSVSKLPLSAKQCSRTAAPATITVTSMRFSPLRIRNARSAKNRAKQQRQIQSAKSSRPRDGVCGANAKSSCGKSAYKQLTMPANKAEKI